MFKAKKSSYFEIGRIGFEVEHHLSFCWNDSWIILSSCSDKPSWRVPTISAWLWLVLVLGVMLFTACCMAWFRFLASSSSTFPFLATKRSFEFQVHVLELRCILPDRTSVQIQQTNVGRRQLSAYYFIPFFNIVQETTFRVSETAHKCAH